MIKLTGALACSYLIGSIPTAYLAGKLLKGIDIRKAGSGNVGATNIYRTVGKIPGFIVLFIDVLKGALPVFLFPALFNLNNAPVSPEVAKIALGIAVISGHVWTIFLKFKGGKGVATAAGVFIALMPKILGIAFLVWLIVFIVFRYVSLASICAAIALPIIAVLFKAPFSIIIFSVTIAIIGTYKHKANIERLIKGDEKKIF